MSESNDIIDLTDSFTLEEDCAGAPSTSNGCDEMESRNDSASVMIVKPKPSADTAKTKTKANSSLGVPKKNAAHASSSLAKEKKIDKMESRNDSASVMIVKPKPSADIAKTKTKANSSLGVPKKNAAPASSSLAKEKKIGGCPICWVELGKNPLASTQCGHVFCIKCIRRHIKIMNICPVCKRILRGSTAYHPIYLSK